MEKYLTDREYRTYFQKLNGLRSRIAQVVPLIPGMRVLDLATGYGYFAIEVARRYKGLMIEGIDIADTDVTRAQKNVLLHNLVDRIHISKMDATHMEFPDHTFDAVVNFLGLEDIHMTRGRKGIQNTFREVTRVLKPRGYFSFVVMPPEMMETEAQKNEVALYAFICRATWLSLSEYATMLHRARFSIVSSNEYYTHKKLTAKQAQKEIEFACSQVPKIYGRHAESFDRVWKRFGKEIETYGLGQYSKVILISTQKIQGTAMPCPQE